MSNPPKYSIRLPLSSFLHPLQKSINALCGRGYILMQNIPVNLCMKVTTVSRYTEKQYNNFSTKDKNKVLQNNHKWFLEKQALLQKMKRK